MLSLFDGKWCVVDQSFCLGGCLEVATKADDRGLPRHRYYPMAASADDRDRHNDRPATTAERGGEPIRSNLACVRPNLVRVRTHVGQIGENPGIFDCIRGGFGQTRNGFDAFRPEWGCQVGPVSKRNPSACEVAQLRGGGPETPLRLFSCMRSGTSIKTCTVASRALFGIPVKGVAPPGFRPNGFQPGHFPPRARFRRGAFALAQSSTDVGGPTPIQHLRNPPRGFPRQKQV